MPSVGFCKAALKRLSGVTTNAAAVRALEKLVAVSASSRREEREAALEAFLAEAKQLNLSLDYIFAGAGHPSPQPHRSVQAALSGARTDQHAGTEQGSCHLTGHPEVGPTAQSLSSDRDL